MTLPAFSGDQAVCVKCGHGGAYTRYAVDSDDEPAFPMRYVPGEDPEFDRQVKEWHPLQYLRRTCARCGYTWPEATQDTKEGA